MTDRARRDVGEKLAARGLAPNRRFGQNFLIDGNVSSQIIDAADIRKNDTVLEIGPGTGALTREIAARAGRLVAVEIDRGLAGLLTEEFADDPQVEIVCGDIMKTDLGAFFEKEIAAAQNTGRPQVKVIANLPYYITTPILIDLMPRDSLFSRFVVMMQKEVADRMQAQPGTKDYGALSLYVQYYVRPEVVTVVPPGAFYPRPEVTSAVLQLDRYDVPPFAPADPKRMFELIMAAFGKRRKTLVNAVAGAPQLGIGAEEMQRALETLGYDTKVRGEALSLADFAALSDALFQTRHAITA